MSLSARAADSSATLLSYAMITTPDPLQASVENASLHLVVSNPGARVVTVTSLVVTLPVGTTAKALTGDATGVEAQVPSGWSASNVAGVITLTPAGTAGQVGPSGLAFVFASIRVNAEVGLCTIAIDETASMGGEPAQERGATVEVPKFPTRFFVSGLQAQPLDVASGGSATLMWTGTDAAYALHYQPADDGPPVREEVGSAGPYTAADLTRAGQVTFTLIVEVRVPGFDQPLTVERQATVTVATLSLEMSVEPLIVPRNGLVRLQWRARNAASCVLAAAPGADPVRPIDTSGSLYLVAPNTTTYTITAVDAKGRRQQQQRTVVLDPTIQTTRSDHGAFGGGGEPGVPGGGPGRPADGGPGGSGADAIISLTLPPLGSDRTRVVRLVAVGGTGGTGGEGSRVDLPSAGGAGGTGGNGIIDVRFDAAAGPPWQYIVDAAGGPGGEGGTGWAWSPLGPVEVPGPRGAAGTGRSEFRDV